MAGSRVTSRRLLALLAFVLLASIAYQTRIRHEMIDFVTWRQSVVRALNAEPLYRGEDGHYQFKYFPAFAVLMAPFGAIDESSGKMLWFALSVAFLAALLYWSIDALPDRRRSKQLLLWITLALMAKFYAHELVLGQVNLMLGALLLAALLAIRNGRPLLAGAIVGATVFIKPYALILVPWLLITQGRGAAAIAGFVVAVGLMMPATVYGWSGNLELLRAWLVTVSDSTAPNLLGNDNVSFAAM